MSFLGQRANFLDCIPSLVIHWPLHLLAQFCFIYTDFDMQIKINLEFYISRFIHLKPLHRIWADATPVMPRHRNYHNSSFVTLIYGRRSPVAIISATLTRWNRTDGIGCCGAWRLLHIRYRYQIAWLQYGGDGILQSNFHLLMSKYEAVIFALNFVSLLIIFEILLINWRLECIMTLKICL